MIKILKNSYPQAYHLLMTQNLTLPFSKKTIPLKKTHFKAIKQVVEKIYQLKTEAPYQKKILNHLDPISQSQQDSMLMGYDFHINEDTVKLIEVNTNASAFLLANFLYQSSNENFEDSLKALKNSFFWEWKKFKPHKKTPKIVLIDEQIKTQKMLIEFFMYKDFFKSMGWDLDILDSHDILIDEKNFLYTTKKERIDFIYNRSTDFYFNKHPHLAKAYKHQTCLILPQPRDYALLADKKRQIDWTQQTFPQIQSIQKYLLKTKSLTKENNTLFWKNRKNYFFKISQGYSGKLVYRGSSVTRKKWEQLLKNKSLAQEYFPPSYLIDSSKQKWKIDIRAYAYKNQIQQLIARIYQGQLTNFKVKGSGFAKIKII
ncbi:MAG: hypothetical protein GDA46_05470 [Bdellovibrionales bacterium]|nr:hypothetical protein [Bdellovibrionales bacterium]